MRSRGQCSTVQVVNVAGRITPVASATRYLQNVGEHGVGPAVLLDGREDGIRHKMLTFVIREQTRHST